MCELLNAIILAARRSFYIVSKFRAWQTKFAKLYPSRLEMYSESLSGKPELLFMDQIDEVIAELQQIKGENAIIIRLKDGFKESKMIITNQVNTHLMSYVYGMVCP